MIPCIGRFFCSLFGLRPSTSAAGDCLNKLDKVRSLPGVVAGELRPVSTIGGGISSCIDSLCDAGRPRLGDLSAILGARRGLFLGDAVAVFGANMMAGFTSSTATGVAGPLTSGETTMGVAIRLIVGVSPLFSRDTEGRAGESECCDGTVLLRCRPLLLLGTPPPSGGVPGLGLPTPEFRDPLELMEALRRIESSLLALLWLLATEADLPSSC